MDDKMKTVYFSHPISHYDTDIEWDCINTILIMLTPIGEDLSEPHIEIMNPNQKWLSNLYKNRKFKTETNPFGIFEEIAISCDIIVGVTFLDGTLGYGVYSEMRKGLEFDKPVYLIFLNDGIKLFMPVTDLSNYKVHSIEKTREKTERGDM